jgi:hypothetical protein
MTRQRSGEAGVPPLQAHGFRANAPQFVARKAGAQFAATRARFPFLTGFRQMEVGADYFQDKLLREPTQRLVHPAFIRNSSSRTYDPQTARLADS